MAQYLVQQGDYPMKIARDFGITFDQFSAMNPGLCVGTQCRVLYVGQPVNVPDYQGGEESTPIAQPVYQQPQQVYQPTTSFTQTPPWMDIAKGELGQREWNPGTNPRIAQYLASVGINGADETSWCGAFVNFCLRAAGMPSAGTGRAANWVTWGRAVQPVYGAITVLQPLAPRASGHVGFLHAIVGRQVWLLSGNSGNAVRLAPYDISKLYNRTPFRWPM
jgi:uncharacterized protein (TIGR02594 family)